MLFASAPSSAVRARAAPCRPAAPMRLITASAWVRSMRPFTKARRVYSPGPAGRAPAAMQASMRLWATTGPPWQLSSTTSSPV